MSLAKEPTHGWEEHERSLAGAVVLLDRLDRIVAELKLVREGLGVK